MNKPKQTSRYREQGSGYQRGVGRGEDEVGKGHQLYDDRGKINF